MKYNKWYFVYVFSTLRYSDVTLAALFSNNRQLDCLFKIMPMETSRKTPNLRVIVGFFFAITCPWLADFPHKVPVVRSLDVTVVHTSWIIQYSYLSRQYFCNIRYLALVECLLVHEKMSRFCQSTEDKRPICSLIIDKGYPPLKLQNTTTVDCLLLM